MLFRFVKTVRSPGAWFREFIFICVLLDLLVSPRIASAQNDRFESSILSPQEWNHAAERSAKRRLATARNVRSLFKLIAPHSGESRRTYLLSNVKISGDILAHCLSEILDENPMGDIQIVVLKTSIDGPITSRIDSDVKSTTKSSQIVFRFDDLAASTRYG